MLRRKTKTLGAKLTFAYAVALIIGLVVFAAISLALVDRISRSTTDRQLVDEATAAAAFVAPEAGTHDLELESPAQFARVVGAGSNGILTSPTGRVLLATTTNAATQIIAFGRTTRAGTRLRTLLLDDAHVRVAAAVVGQRSPSFGAVVVWRSIDGIADLVRRIALGFALAIPLIVVAATVTGRAIVRRLLAPLRELAALASSIEAQDLSRRLRRGGSDELGLLCATFDHMLDRLDAAFARERRFAGDAAHELRAPLAVIMAEIDVTRRRARESAEYERALDQIRGEASHLDELATDLLAMSRDEGRMSRVDTALDAIASQSIQRLAPLALLRTIEVVTSFERDTIVHVDPHDIERATMAALDNAFKYGGDGGEVVVRALRDPDSLRLEIQDGGAGFSSDALAHATERFWRGDRARARDGVGLGLALASILVQRNGGTLSLANAPGGGGIVRMTFPAPETTTQA